MRYVRTENEIIDLNYCVYFEKEERWWNETECFSFYKNEIIKKADTIEELCDEFVYHFLRNDTYQIMPKTDLEPQRRDCLSYHIEKKLHDVLGAIWTDKGLIYVAKMNDEGEVELL